MPSSKFVLTCSGLLALYLVGLGLTVAGFATDNWIDFAGGNYGLFRVCSDGFGCDKIEISLYEDWQTAVLAFMIIGIAVTVAGGATYMFVPVSSGLQILGGVCTIIAVGIFGAYQAVNIDGWDPSFLGFSFALAAAGGACVIINGIILLVLLSKEGDGMTMEMILPGGSGKVGAS